MALTFVDWEGRPAVISGSSALFVRRSGASWEPARVEEVADSGALVSEEAFKRLFPSAPPLPAVFSHSGVKAAA